MSDAFDDVAFDNGEGGGGGDQGGGSKPAQEGDGSPPLPTPPLLESPQPDGEIPHDGGGDVAQLGYTGDGAGVSVITTSDDDADSSGVGDGGADGVSPGNELVQKHHAAEAMVAGVEVRTWSRFFLMHAPL